MRGGTLFFVFWNQFWIWILNFKYVILYKLIPVVWMMPRILHFPLGFMIKRNFQWKWWKAMASIYKVHNCDTKYFPKITANFCASTKPKKEPELWVNKKLNSIVFFHSCFSRRKPCKVNQMTSRALQSHWSLSRSPSRLIGWGEGEVEIHHLVS